MQLISNCQEWYKAFLITTFSKIIVSSLQTDVSFQDDGDIEPTLYPIFRNIDLLSWTPSKLQYVS